MKNLIWPLVYLFKRTIPEGFSLANRTRKLTQQEIQDIEKMLWGTIPERPSLEFFLDNRMMILLSKMTQYLGLNAFVIRRYAGADSERMKKMGLVTIGAKFYANCHVFVEWALTHRPTCRRIMLHYLDELGEPPVTQDVSDILTTGKKYLFSDLCSAKLIPRPFCTRAGKQTLYETAGKSENPQDEMGFYKHETYKRWIVDPMPFFSFLGHKYGLMDDAQ